MKHRHTPAFFAALCIIFSISMLSGCRLPNSFSNAGSSESNFQMVSSTEEILTELVHTMERNAPSCQLLITDEALMDADMWLSALPGIEKIHCEYQNTAAGCNALITLEYWDNYAIVYAHRSRDMQYLTPDQQVLYNKYISVLSDCTSPDMPDYANELAIHDYLVTHLEYDTRVGTSYNAYEALINGKAVCGGYAECFKTFMDLLNIENITLSGTAGDEQHIWNAVRLNDDCWYQVDVTWDDPVNATIIALDHAYFNISDKDMAIDHTWSETPENYETADSSRYSYPEIAGLLHISSQSMLNAQIAQYVREREIILEFTAEYDLDLKTSIALTDTTLSYAYRTAKRNDYILYTIFFTYDY